MNHTHQNNSLVLHWRLSYISKLVSLITLSPGDLEGDIFLSHFFVRSRAARGGESYEALTKDLEVPFSKWTPGRGWTSMFMYIYIYNELELLYADTCFGKICTPLNDVFFLDNEKSELQFHYVDSMSSVLKMLHLYDPWEWMELKVGDFRLKVLENDHSTGLKPSILRLISGQKGGEL